jgi:uncharacterized protein with HEPN domain
MNMIVLGEGSNHLSADLKSMEAKVPWDDMVGMRNRLAHTYMRVNLRRVWEAATYDVPKLQKPLTRLLQSLGPEAED